MWSHMLPMTVVVMSHIMSICPSTAAPQNLVIPSAPETEEFGIPSKYEDVSSWEEESSSPIQKESNALLQAAFLLSSPRIGIDSGDTIKKIPNKSGQTSSSRTGPGTVKVFKRSGGIRHQFEFDPWTVPTLNRIQGESNGNENEILLDGHQQPGSAPGTEEMSMMIPTYFRNRVMKRSPRCLRRCLAQGLLHPSQCHSLC